MDGALRGVRGLVSKKKRRFQEDGFDLDLTYVTSRIIAMGFPSMGAEAMYRNPLPEVQRFFESRHKDRYRIYNLCSEREYEPADFHGRVARFPFDDHNPCLLDLIAKFCTDVDDWMSADDSNVAAIHCKAGKGRTGLMISAYLLHSGFARTALEALAYFGESRTSNKKGVTIPSQMRFVHYYEHILRHGPSPVFSYRITHIRLVGVPNIKTGGGCEPYFWVIENNIKVYDHKESCDLTRFRPADENVDLDLTDQKIVVRDNVKIQFFDKGDGVKKKVKMFHFWFHTAYVSSNYLHFGKGVIDKAVKDKHCRRYKREFAVEIFLHKVPDAEAAELRKTSTAFLGSDGKLEEVHTDEEEVTDEEEDDGDD